MTTVAQACQQIATLAPSMEGIVITRARQWRALDKAAAGWVDQPGQIANVVWDLWVALQDKMNTPDQDQYGVRVDSARADDQIVRALRSLAPRCKAAGAPLN